MFRNTYDSDNTVFSPQGRLHQVEYALEAVKQGSAVVGLRSNTHAILVALKRAPSELASYQKKMLRIDNHMGIGFRRPHLGRARSLHLHASARPFLAPRLLSTPPISRVVDSLADRAQFNTMDYGKRPYGVGFLIIGVDDTGPHLYEFSPTANCFEYYAMSIGARSQSAKTYLERKYEEFASASLEDLVLHGLYALRDTLPQNKDLELDQVSVAVVGPGADADVNSAAARRGEKFRVVEGEELRPYMDRLEPKTLPGARATATSGTEGAAAAEGGAGAGEGAGAVVRRRWRIRRGSFEKSATSFSACSPLCCNHVERLFKAAV